MRLESDETTRPRFGCYSVTGDLKWHVDLGELDVGPHNSMDLHWGYASSPVIADGKVIVQADVKKDPFLAAWDVASGKPVLPDELIDYALNEGASLDWLVCGDPSSLVCLYRREETGDGVFRNLLSKWQDAHARHLAACEDYAHLEKAHGVGHPTANEYNCTVVGKLIEEKDAIERAIVATPAKLGVGLAVKAAVIADDAGTIWGEEGSTLDADARRILEGK